MAYFQCDYCLSIKKECVIVPGNHKCWRCLKGKKGCKLTVADKEEEEKEEDNVEEESQKPQLPVASSCLPFCIAIADLSCRIL